MRETVATATKVKNRTSFVPLLLLAALPLVVAGTVPDATAMRSDTAILKAIESSYVPVDHPVGAIAAPMLESAVDPVSFIQGIVVIPNPVVVAAPARGKRAQVAPGMTYIQFCEAGGGASVSASSVYGLLDAVNAERARLGIAPLAWRDSLAGAALSWSNQMAADQSNSPQYNLQTVEGYALMRIETTTKGSPWFTNVFRHSGSGGENIYFHYGSGEASIGGAHRGFMRSSGHCKNVMNPQHTTFGAGEAKATDGGYFATQRFG